VNLLFAPIALEPLGVTITTSTVPVPDGATAVTDASLATEKVAETPPKVTDDAPVNPLPETLTEVPIGPVFGLSRVTTGGGNALPIITPGSKIIRCAVSSV
jgi:hypothetical protein